MFRLEIDMIVNVSVSIFVDEDFGRSHHLERASKKFNATRMILKV